MLLQAQLRASQSVKDPLGGGQGCGSSLSGLDLVPQRTVGFQDRVALLLIQLLTRHREVVKLVLQAFALVCNGLLFDGNLQGVEETLVDIVQQVTLLLQLLGVGERQAVKLVLQRLAVSSGLVGQLGEPLEHM